MKDYKGIKIGLQTELLTLRIFIELYFEHAYEDRIRKKIYPQIYIYSILHYDITNKGTIEFLKGT